MNSRLFIAALLALALNTSSIKAEDAPPSWTAKFVATDSLFIAASDFGLPPYLVEVNFPNAFSTNLVRAISSYTLTRDSELNKSVPLRWAHPLGGNLTSNNTNGWSTNTTWHGSATATGVWLVPMEPLDPSASYHIAVVLGETNSPTIAISPAQDAPVQDNTQQQGELTRIYHLTTNVLSGRLSVDVSGNLAFDGSKTPTLEYAANFDLLAPKLVTSGNKWSGWLYTASLASEGLLKSKASDSNINDHLNFSANGEALWIYQVQNPLFANTNRTLAYYAGLRLKAVEIEADQQFDVVNLTVKPQFAAWIPWSNIPALWWQKAIGITGNAATPISIFAGYTFSDSLKQSSTVNSALQKSDRLEAEIAYAFPLTSNIRIGTRDRLFWLFDAHEFKSYEEVYVRRYLDQHKTTSIQLKYAHGEIPPTFEKGDAATAGFSVEY